MALTTERVNVIFDADASPVIQEMKKTSAAASQLQSRIDKINADAAAQRNLLLATVGDTLVEAGKRYLSVLTEIGTATSDLIEQTNFAQRVFGDAFEGVKKFAEGAAEIGFSTTSALQASAALGVFGKTAGLAGRDLVKFTEELVTLAADMASIRNTKPEEAIIALAAAMRSEYEPLRRFGVVLNDVQLRQRAFNLGIYDGTGALNSSQRILAARAEVMDQLSFAMGDFVRTQDQFANSQRVLNAEMENFKAALGEGVLPLMLGLTKAANALLAVFNDLPSSLQGTIGALGLLAASLTLVSGRVLQLISVLGQLKAAGQLTGLVSVIGSALPFAAVAAIAAIGGLGAAWLVAADDARDVSKAVEGLNEALKATRGDTVAALELQLRGIADDKRITEAFKTMGISAQDFIADAKVALDGGKKEMDDFKKKYKELAESFMNTPGFDQRMLFDILGATEQVTELDEAWTKVKRDAELAGEAASEAAAKATLEEMELLKALEREHEQLVKNYQTASRAKNTALEDLAEAKIALVEAQADAQEQLDDATRRYNESLADQERSIERQRRSVEDAQRAIVDAQRAVVEAIRAEAKARDAIDRAIRDQVDAQRQLVDAQEDVVDAQEEFAEATRTAEGILRGYGRASQEAADALENLDDAQRRVRGSQLSLEDSSLSLADAQTQLDRLRRFYGNTSSPSALRRLADAERTVARAKFDHEEAVDALQDTTKEAADAQDEYNWTVNGYPATSDKARQAMDAQRAASEKLEGAIEAVEDANRRVIDSQIAVDDARYAASNAALAVEEANRRVQYAAQDAAWASDDLRRSEWELAAYRASGQPTMAMDGIRAAEEQIRDARNRLAAETIALMYAEQQLAAFRLANREVFTPPTNIAPGFMSGAPPAGTGGFPASYNTTHRIQVDVRGIADPYQTGRYIAENLIRYLQVTGQMPQHGSVWNV